MNGPSTSTVTSAFESRKQETESVNMTDSIELIDYRFNNSHLEKQPIILVSNLVEVTTGIEVEIIGTN